MTHEHSAHHLVVAGFGADRAPHYDAQAAINLAGAPAIYELGASALTAQLDGQDAASILFVGVGTGAELVPYHRFEVPGWRFTGVEPSEPMLAVARKRLEDEGLRSRTHLHQGALHTLPASAPFDGAQVMGVLHHVEGEEARMALLREVTRRLKPGAPLVLGCRVGMDPVLTDIELRRLRACGVSPEALERRRQMSAQMKPIPSDAALFDMFARAGLVEPRTLFVSLQYKVFLARNAP
ncbi:class I SAM-dependent methyltransferase [Myxococcus sp. AM009]|uniref:class I SAM-dependent methyltransferase n=1 Tax=unclassified Myxococcus TaxID=2648731 RepID=UPI0015958304|nr:MULTISPECIES: class I SAM-dependent methyltransferase [unclassified Myxococcus]NVI97346.1 class I SAM-dependent methyltransferase [Myxococcus sp. AM009]NVJ17994.1 class I SAM-dependent methyltransferase [Myxococcus sp. AM010]